MAIKAIEVFIDFIKSKKFSTPNDLFFEVRKVGKEIINADKMNFTVGNIVKRIFHIMREEFSSKDINLEEETKD